MISLPPHLVKTSIPRAGNGIFTTKTIDAGEEVLRIERPLVAVLNQGQLTSACEWCLVWVGGQGDGDWEDGEKKVRLRACQGCRVVRYCSKACQTSSWAHHHRHECKIFSKLYPNVLPNTVRILLQLLLRRKAKSITDCEWESLLSLQSHLSSFRSSSATNSEGLTTYQTIELMSKAALKYSSTKESLDFIQNLTATTLINALTLTTHSFDPLGLSLSPSVSLINHSCTPNTTITYSNASLSVRSLTPIPPATQVTISYIDTTDPTPTRRAELLKRYFFTCACPSCSAGTTNGIPDPPEEDDWKATKVKAIELQNEASTRQPDEATSPLSQALAVLSPYPPTRQPYAAILHTAFLNAVTMRYWPVALVFKLKEYLDIDPVHNQPDFHPVRVVHKWVLVRLVVQIAGLIGENDGGVESLKKFGVDWRIVVLNLLMEVEGGIVKSHGQGSAFALEVESFKKGIGLEGSMVIEMEAKAREWRKLRRIADGLGKGKVIGLLE